MYNPHPKMADLQSTPEIVFIGTGSGASDAFNEEQSASAGLQEIVTLFPGLLRSRSVGSGLEFTPLLRTGPIGGTIAWSDFAMQGFMGFSGVNPRRRHMRSDTSYTLAARVTGQAAAEGAKDAKKEDEKKDTAKKKDDKTPAAKINVIAIADLDFMGEQFFELRRRKIEDLEFDNVLFVLNCVDVLAGDESFVRLRRKRPVHRRLDALEARAKEFDKVLADKTKQAEQMATDQLEQAQQAFREAGRCRAGAHRMGRAHEGDPACEHPASRAAAAGRRQAGHRRQEAERDSRGEDRLRATNTGDSQLGTGGGRGRAAAAAAFPGTLCVVLAPDARESGSQSEAARL